MQIVWALSLTFIICPTEFNLVLNRLLMSREWIRTDNYLQEWVRIMSEILILEIYIVKSLTNYRHIRIIILVSFSNKNAGGFLDLDNFLSLI